jgi:(2S)-methylsuccinyl-CoA dehydrogenase
MVERAAFGVQLQVASGDARTSAARLDALQLPCYDLALCEAELAAAQALLEHAQTATRHDALAGALTASFVIENVASSWQRLSLRPADYGLGPDDLWSLSQQLATVAPVIAAAELDRLGAALVERDGRLPPTLLADEHESMRDAFASFASDVVAAEALRIHAEDADIPDTLIDGAARLGLFGVSIPQRYGGLQPDERPDTLAMLVVTEAMSRESLGAAGSLVTRPEIMARALREGGTDAQRARWLPRLASGESLCAIAITEPDFGSDVASLRMRADRVAGGWRLSGAKMWCTFAGRADVIFVVARTSADASAGHKGLSVFLVEKPRCMGHTIDVQGPNGGRLKGRAIRTLGYRGMHSFELSFDDWIAPPDALLGGEAGEGRGFYLTMAGMAGGRLQTAARANGVMQAAFDEAMRYTRGRRVFGRPVADYALTRTRLARMAACLTASRQLSYAVARRLDAGGDGREASLAKLFACRAAEWVTRDAMQMHGGMGYAEETTASRLFVDARVLSIFEGAEETLALKVIARELLHRAAEKR